MAEPADAAPSPGQGVAVATFGRRENAEATRDRLAAAGIPARIRTMTGTRNPLWQVVAGPDSSGAETALLAKVKAAGFADAYLLPQ